MYVYTYATIYEDTHTFQEQPRESIADFYIERPFCSLYTHSGTPALVYKPLLPCIKLFPTEGNSNRLQGFIRQTLINLIISTTSQPVHERSKDDPLC